MIEWAEWSDAEATTDWDQRLVDLPDHSVYQAYGWGEYQRRRGWNVRRGSVVIDGIPAAMAQCLIREIRLARVAVVWVPGGAAGSVAGRLRLGEALRRRYRGWSLCLRANIAAERRPEGEVEMLAAGWSPADIRLGHPLTFHVDLELDEAVRRKALHANWRHNLKRGEQRTHRVVRWEAPAPLAPVFAVYREVVGLKHIAPTMRLEDLSSLREAFGRSFTLAVALDGDGAPLAIRGCARIGTRAWDLVAGASSAGRRAYASYVVTWRLLEIARQLGVRVYDMSGADPVGAPGVYNFKRGLGGRAVLMVGEWEWSTSRVLRWGLNRAVWGRAGCVLRARTE